MTVLPDDNTEEVLDVLDASGNVIGSATRAEVHAKGLWHRTFHCLVMRSLATASINSGSGELGSHDGAASGVAVVLQRRSLASRTFPGLIDLTASGHLTTGEEPRHGIRELAEETGLIADPQRLLSLGVHVIVDERPGRLNREHVHVFLLVDNTPLTGFDPNHNEVEGLIEVSTTDLLELFHRQRLHDNRFQIEAIELSATHRVVNPVLVTPDDLIPDSHNYFVKVLIMAERHARGLRPLAI